MPEAMFAADDLHVYYGQSHILQGVSLHISPGTVLGLLGRNGAGKTSTLNAIMGIIPRTKGRIYFAGKEITHYPPYRIARQGIAYVPEHRGLFPSLSVEEHFSILPRNHTKQQETWTLPDIYRMFPRLEERRTLGAGQLSGGEQQMLAIARALLLNPSLLILDEPSEGLAPVIVQEITSILTQLKQTGLTLLLVEQNYALITRLSDKVMVLGKGQMRWAGTPGDLHRNTAIKHTWLGI